MHQLHVVLTLSVIFDRVASEIAQVKLSLVCDLGLSRYIPIISQNATSRLYRQSSFPCPRTYNEPFSSPGHGYQSRSVHNLRPMDIDIVASVGDSITAGVFKY